MCTVFFTISYLTTKVLGLPIKRTHRVPGWSRNPVERILPQLVSRNLEQLEKISILNMLGNWLIWGINLFLRHSIAFIHPSVNGWSAVKKTVWRWSQLGSNALNSKPPSNCWLCFGRRCTLYGETPTTMGFPTNSDHFGVFWGYHHFRKHPYYR